MNLLYIEVEDIYFSKTREYFREVTSSYGNGNYRSAIVMLYSITICDLLFKLKELDDIYMSKNAKNILEEIEEDKNKNKFKSEWEKKLINNISDTSLLDNNAKASLDSLCNYRNLCAHPALNENYELISPNKETTIFLIKSIFENILIKPPIFIDKMFNLLIDDISKNKEIYHSKAKLSEYLKNKYYKKMTSEDKASMLKSFWKICFNTENDECNENRDINIFAMTTLFSNEETYLCNYISENKNYFQIKIVNDKIMFFVTTFLSVGSNVFKYLDSHTQKVIEFWINENEFYKLISWFIYENINDYIKVIRNLNNKKIGIFLYNNRLEYQINKYLKNFLVDNNLKEVYIDICINIFGNSAKYSITNYTYKICIQNNLNEINKQQFEELFKYMQTNTQIYNRDGNYETTTEIIKSAMNKLPKDFDYSEFNLKFDETILQ